MTGIELVMSHGAVFVLGTLWGLLIGVLLIRRRKESV